MTFLLPPMINDVNSVTWDDGCRATEGPLHRLPKLCLPIGSQTTVVCASKNLLLLQSSHGAAGSGLGEELLPLIRLPAQFSVRAADVIHLRIVT